MINSLVLLTILFVTSGIGPVPIGPSSGALNAPQNFTGDADPKSWKAFSSPEGQFTVLMPGTPKEEIQYKQTELGQIEIHLFVLQSSGAAYITSYADFPITATTPEMVEKMLDGARDNVLANSTRKLLEESKISLDGLSGREMKIGMPDLVLKTRFYVAQRRLYQVMMITPDPNQISKKAVAGQNANATKFLGSLKIIQAGSKRI